MTGCFVKCKTSMKCVKFFEGVLDSKRFLIGQHKHDFHDILDKAVIRKDRTVYLIESFVMLFALFHNISLSLRYLTPVIFIDRKRLPDNEDDKLYINGRCISSHLNLIIKNSFGVKKYVRNCLLVYPSSQNKSRQ